MIKLSEKLANIVVNNNSYYPMSTTNMITQIESHAKVISRLYIKIHVKLYDTPRPEFLKQCKL